MFDNRSLLMKKLADMMPPKVTGTTMSLLTPCMVKVPATAGAVQVEPDQEPAPPVAVQVMALLNAPLTMLLKAWLVLAVMVGLAGVTALMVTGCGATT